MTDLLNTVRYPTKHRVKPKYRLSDEQENFEDSGLGMSLISNEGYDGTRQESSTNSFLVH